MKTLILSSIVSLLIAFSGVLYADTVVTTDEWGAPITVTNETYTVATPSYYYYTGHRCYVKERPDISANFLGLRASVGGSNEIYCYPYP